MYVQSGKIELDLVGNKSMQLLQKIVHQNKITEVQVLYNITTGDLNLYVESLQYNIFLNVEFTKVDLMNKKDISKVNKNQQEEEIDIFNVTDDFEMEEIIEDYLPEDGLTTLLSRKAEGDTILRFSTESSIVEIMTLSPCTINVSDTNIVIEGLKSKFQLPFLSTEITMEDIQELRDVEYPDELDTTGVVIANTLSKLNVPLSMQFIGIKDGKIYTHSDRIIIEKNSWKTKYPYILNMQSIFLLKLLSIFQGERIFISQMSDNFLTTHIRITNVTFKSVSANIEVIDSILTLLNETSVLKIGTIMDYQIMRILNQVSSTKDGIINITSNDKGMCIAKKEGNIVLVSTANGFRSNIDITVNLEELETAIKASGKPNPSLGLIRESGTENLMVSGLQKVLIPCIEKG